MIRSRTLRNKAVVKGTVSGRLLVLGASVGKLSKLRRCKNFVLWASI